MKRTQFIVIVTAALLTVCAAWRISESVAEPISGSDLTAASGTSPQTREVTEAMARFKERDFDGALELLKEAVEKNPDLPPAHVLMAQLFSQVNMPTAVRTALERAVIDSPNDPEAYMIMADIAIRDRRVTEAKMLYDKAQSLLADWTGSAKRKEVLQPQLYNGLAATYEAREQWADAQKQLDAWLKLDPKNTLALQRLAQCLFHQEDVDGALEKLKEAAKIDPDILTPEAILAQYYAQSDDQDNARKWMIAALTAAPRDLKTRLVAAQWAWESGKLDEAKKQAAAAMQLDTNSLNAKILFGVIALFQKDYRTAETYFESAYLQSPRNFPASNNLALALIEQKDEAKKQRALEYAEANVRQYPKVADAASTYGWVLYKLGKLDDAEKVLRAAVSGPSFSADTAYYLARVLVDRGRDADAKQLLESALRTSGPFAQRDDAETLLKKLEK